MLVHGHVLLCAAALLIHGVEQATADPRLGRLGPRVSLVNLTTPTLVSSGTATAEGTLSTFSPVTIASSSETSLLPSSSASAVTTISNVADSPLSLQTIPVGNLATITAAGRPNPPAVGSSSASPIPSSFGPGLSSNLISVPSSVPSLAIFTITSTAVPPVINIGTIPEALPTLLAPPPNITAASSGWNATASTAGGISLVTLTLAPTLPVTTIYPDGCATNTGTITTWSVIHANTTTITWTLDPTDYTPPFPVVSTPTACVPSVVPIGRLTVSVCGGSGEPCTEPATVPVLTTFRSLVPPGQIATPKPAAASTAEVATAAAPSIIFYTTDKNPVIVYSSDAPPNYGATGAAVTVDHNSATGGDVNTAPGYNVPVTLTSPAEGQQATTAPGDKSQAITGVTVVIQTTQVVIDGKTFTNDPSSSKTSTVVVGTDTFVINPSEVIGAGATLVRPTQIGGVYVATPTTTTLGKLQVVYGGSVASIDGTIFTIDSTSKTAVVQGQTITLGPTGITGASQTIPVIKQAAATEVAVLGGELITAIGNSIAVFDGTTITYGPASSTVTETVGNDTILIGPSGVLVHGLTLGGSTAEATATTYEIVGGATITEVGSTAVVVGGTTFLLGSGATTTLTTVIGGETLTIGPQGVSMSTFTYAQPYATTTMLVPGETSSVASATGAKNAGPILRPNWDLGFMGLGIGCGAGILAQLL